MKLELAPVALRIRPAALNSYKVYLDSLIGMKLSELDRIKQAITPPQDLTRATI